MGQGNSNFKKTKKRKNKQEEGSQYIYKREEQYHLDLGEDDEFFNRKG